MVGNRAQYFWVTAMTNLPAVFVEADEVWGFVYAKEKTCVAKHLGPECGDAYTFLAIERETRLILTWHVGRREEEDTAWFADKLRRATAGRFQLTTDGFRPYCTAIPEAFSGNIDFAQLVKTYGKPRGSKGDSKAEVRCSPGEINGIKKRQMWGRPDMSKVCTSHIERKNLSIRMRVRRMTRLTNAFSKKWEIHEYHLALWFLYYDFCRPHVTLTKQYREPTSPAIASGLSDHLCSMEELLERLTDRA